MEPSILLDICVKLTMKENIPEGILPEAGVRRVSKTRPAPFGLPVGAKGVWGIPAGRMCSLLNELQHNQRTIYLCPFFILERTPKYMYKCSKQIGWSNCIVRVYVFADIIKVTIHRKWRHNMHRTNLMFNRIILCSATAKLIVHWRCTKTLQWRWLYWGMSERG